ncbi:MAG: VWA domain-containing protein, partial [Syntrophales bacterium]|nr:VWA domain-containing protein [Syntrophales bacterium]
GMESLDGDIAMLSMAGSPLSGSEASGLREAREELLAYTRDYVKTFFEFSVKTPGEDPNRQRNFRLAQLDDREMEVLKGIVKRIVRRLNDLYWRKRRSWSRGHLDFRKTQRRSVPFGGIPFHVSWKHKKRDRTDMMVLCDISQSVRTVVRFFLLFLYGLNEELVKIRTFVFCSNLVEAGDLFEGFSPEEGIERIQSGDELDISLGRTDYGQAFRDFKALALNSVTRKTTIIILGDARSNFYEPEAGILKEIHGRARRLIWLNPEIRPLWGSGDSAMKQYLPCCTFVKECNTLAHLEGIVHSLLKD